MVRKAFVPILISLVLLSAVFPARVVPRAHAATTGLVCIASISDVSGGRCPAAPPSFNGPFTTPNTLLRVPIMINNTDTFNGFDITVNSTRDSGGHSVLKPYGVDLTGSVMPANSIPLAECAGATSIVGNSCALNMTIDNPTSVRAAVIFSNFLPIGTSGLLFTAVFSIIGTSAIGGVTIGFQNHCSPYPSASSNGHLCISISNGTTGAAPENVQTGGFDDSDTTTLPYATLTTPTINLGQSLAGSPVHPLPAVIYTVTSQNGFQASTTPQLTLSVSFNGTSSLRPTAALNMSALDLTGLSAHPFIQTNGLGSNVPAGVYVATVTATYQTADLITFTTDSLSAAYSLPLNVTDFTLSTSVRTISIQPPSSQPINVTVVPKAGFNSPVKLGLIIPPATSSAGISASLSTTTILGGTGTSILTITTSPATPHGTFQLTITGNATLNGLSTTRLVPLTVVTVRPDFSISANPTTIVFPSASPSSTLTLTSFNFTGVVQVTVLFNGPAPGLEVTINPYLVGLRQNGQNTTTVSIQSFASVPAGTYTLTFSGTSGFLVHSLNITVLVPISPPSDFTISANPSFLSLASGSSSGTSSIMVSSLNGFSGNIQLSASSLTGGPGGTLALSLNPSQLILTSGSSASSILTVTASNLAPGTYFVNVTGTHLSTMHSVLVTVQVPAPPDFQLFVNTNIGGNTILAGTTTFFGVQVNGVGPAALNGNITLTGQASPGLPNGPIVSLNPSQVALSPNQQYGFSTLTISTTVLTPPGNYTITVQGASGTIIHTVRFQLTVLPPPVLLVSPAKGPVGTQVTVHGSGFVFPSQPGFFSPVQVEMTFDDQLVGLFYLQGSSFNFTFNVPESQAGIVHLIHAKVLFFFPTLDVQANFLVLQEPSSLAVDIDSGTIYFPGDTATIFAMTTLNGQATTVTSLQIILVKPNGSNITLNTVNISPGVYRATFTVPTTGSLGTYAILANAHQTGLTDASGLVSFEVKPTWLSSNGHTIVTATTIVGAVGALGLMGLAWRKGYFSKKRDDFPGF